MEWIQVDERLPEVGEPCWYFFDLVGTHKGFYGGLYEDRPSMSIFYCDYGFLTGDVTHWHPDQEETPSNPEGFKE